MIRNDLCSLNCAIRQFNEDRRADGIKSLRNLYHSTRRKDIKFIVEDLARTYKVAQSLITRVKVPALIEMEVAATKPEIVAKLKQHAEKLALDLLHPNASTSTSDLVRLVDKYREDAEVRLSSADFVIWNRWFSLTLSNGRASSDVEAA